MGHAKFDAAGYREIFSKINIVFLEKIWKRISKVKRPRGP